MHLSRTLPSCMLDSSGYLTPRALDAACREAARRGLRYVPAGQRPARLGECCGLWMDAGGTVTLILRRGILYLSARA